jgi:hypothetical protein
MYFDLFAPKSKDIFETQAVLSKFWQAIQKKLKQSAFYFKSFVWSTTR